MSVTSSRWRPAAATLGAALLLVSACSKSENSGSGATATPAGSATAQVVQSASAGAATCTADQLGYPKLDLKTAKVGFSQSEKEANPFRITETASIKAEAAKEGITNLVTANANSQFPKQIADVEQMIDGGVQALIIAPLNSDGWDSVFAKAAAKHIPIVTIDRQINATPCKNYLTFIGSDFTKQGQRAADEMAKAMNNKGNLAILLGSPGNNVTTGRTNGFTAELAKVAPNIKIVFQQTANFDRADGQTVTEQLLQSHPDVNAIYGENDEEAIGAITALKSAGKKPGDIKVVSVDGTQEEVKNIVAGWANADIESNPRFGPLAFQALNDFTSGKPVDESIIIQDNQYDSATAAANVANAY